MEPEERVLRAYDLSLSAFLGDTIYNFGELLMHPILDSLNGTPHEWITKLLYTFNEGNIGKFEALAPLFSREVSVLKLETHADTHDVPRTGYLARELPLPTTKNLPHGSHRICVQEKRLR